MHYVNMGFQWNVAQLYIVQLYIVPPLHGSVYSVDVIYDLSYIVKWIYQGSSLVEKQSYVQNIRFPVCAIALEICIYLWKFNWD
jgi:hypothetical protein